MRPPAAFLLFSLDRDAMCLGILEKLLARGEVPLPPRRDHADPGVERVIGELEAHLVVALAGAAVRDRVRADPVRDLDLALGDQRPRDRGAEQVLALVLGVGPEHGEDEVAHELLAQVVDEDPTDAELPGLSPRRRELLALADVRGEGHHLAPVGVLQPFQDDRGVEPAGIGEHHFFDLFHLMQFKSTAKTPREAKWNKFKSNLTAKNTKNAKKDSIIRSTTPYGLATPPNDVFLPVIIVVLFLALLACLAVQLLSYLPWRLFYVDHRSPWVLIRPRSRYSIRAFWVWSRFSASSHTTLCGPSITAAATSSPRCAGRPCQKSGVLRGAF